jgi:hypothetical protein
MSECTHKEFVLSMLRSAVARFDMCKSELTGIGIALKDDMITPAEAVKWINDIGAADAVGKIPDEIVNGSENAQ